MQARPKAGTTAQQRGKKPSLAVLRRQPRSAGTDLLPPSNTTKKEAWSALQVKNMRLPLPPPTPAAPGRASTSCGAPCRLLLLCVYTLARPPPPPTPTHTTLTQSKSLPKPEPTGPRRGPKRRGGPAGRRPRAASPAATCRTPTPACACKGGGAQEGQGWGRCLAGEGPGGGKSRRSPRGPAAPERACRAGRRTFSATWMISQMAPQLSPRTKARTCDGRTDRRRGPREWVRGVHREGREVGKVNLGANATPKEPWCQAQTFSGEVPPPCPPPAHRRWLTSGSRNGEESGPSMASAGGRSAATTYGRGTTRAGGRTDEGVAGMPSGALVVAGGLCRRRPVQRADAAGRGRHSATACESPQRRARKGRQARDQEREEGPKAGTRPRPHLDVVALCAQAGRQRPARSASESRGSQWQQRPLGQPGVGQRRRRPPAAPHCSGCPLHGWC